YSAANTACIQATQYRLNHLDPMAQATLITTLKAVQLLSAWQSRPSPAPRSDGSILCGRGVSLGYLSTAHAAEVEVAPKSGKVNVKRISVAVNIGQLISPDATAAQVQGGTIIALSRAIKDQVIFGKNQITSADWVTYPIAR